MKPVRVLLVEDSRIDTRLIKALSNMHKFRLTAVGSVAELESLGPDYHPDVVLTDLNLPDCEGIQTVHAVRGRFPGTPIVVWSAADVEVIEGMAEKVIEAGADDILCKSDFNYGRIYRAVTLAILRNRSRDKETRANISALNLLAIRARELGKVRHAPKTG